MLRPAIVLCCLLAVPVTASAQDSGLLAPLVAPTKKKTHHHHRRHRRHRRHHEKPAAAAQASPLLAPLVASTHLSVSVAGGVSHAEVWVDGVKWGAAPISDRSVDPGTHLVVVRRKGYAELTREVTVARGKKASVELSLVPMDAVVTLLSEPSGARIMVDGKRVGVSPVDELLLTPGRHVLRAETADSTSGPLPVEVRAGHDYAFTLKLSEAPVELTPATPPESPAVAALDQKIPEPSHVSKPWYSRWYVWAGVGVVAAAATVTAVELTGGKSPTPVDPTAVCGGPCAGVLRP